MRAVNGTKKRRMSEPTAGRTEHSRSGRDAYRPGSGVRSGRWAARPAVVRSVYTATALVTASRLLPFDGHRTAGALALPVCGLPMAPPAEQSAGTGTTTLDREVGT